MTGGLWSASRKQKVQEALEKERAMQEEFERQKKYSGPVGKNPWGNISQNWTKTGKGGLIDFAAELEIFKDLRGRNAGGLGSMDARKKLMGISRSIDRPLQPAKKDWDAPENYDEEAGGGPAERRVPVRGLKRGRSSDLDDDDDDDDDLEEEEDKWNKKLKRPRMSMVADEEESRFFKLLIDPLAH